MLGKAIRYFFFIATVTACFLPASLGWANSKLDLTSDQFCFEVDFAGRLTQLASYNQGQNQSNRCLSVKEDLQNSGCYHYEISRGTCRNKDDAITNGPIFTDSSCSLIRCINILEECKAGLNLKMWDQSLTSEYNEITQEKSWVCPQVP